MFPLRMALFAGRCFRVGKIANTSQTTSPRSAFDLWRRSYLLTTSRFIIMIAYNAVIVVESNLNLQQHLFKFTNKKRV